MISQVMNVNLRFLFGHMHGTIVFFDFCQIQITAKMKFSPGVDGSGRRPLPLKT